MRVLCSTGCFIGYRNRYDFRLLEYANKVLSCDGFEILLPFDNQDCIEVANYILNHAIFTPCVHADKRIGILISTGTNESIKKALDLFEDNCKFARYVGAEIVVLHLWGGKKSDSNIRQNILHFQDLKDIANQYGLIISVENVPCVVSDSLNCFEILRKKYNDIFFTFDSRFAAFQNIQQELFDNKLIVERINHIHVSDYSGGKNEWDKLSIILGIGEGEIDFVNLFELINSRVSCQYITLESPCYKNDKCDFLKLEENIVKVKKLIKVAK